MSPSGERGTSAITRFVQQSHSGGKLLGRSFLHPPFAMVMAQHDGAIEQGEADP